VVLLFGGKRLPEAARGLGRSMRIFKSEVRQLNEESPKPSGASTAPSSDALEGRIVTNESPRTENPTRAPHDA